MFLLFASTTQSPPPFTEKVLPILVVTDRKYQYFINSRVFAGPWEVFTVHACYSGGEGLFNLLSGRRGRTIEEAAKRNIDFPASMPLFQCIK